jgi:hypothetical protein
VRLDDRARGALQAVRLQAATLRFAVEHICGSSRHRLSVYYTGAGYRGSATSEEFRLGLLYSDDAAGLEAVKHQLEAEARMDRPAQTG